MDAETLNIVFLVLVILVAGYALYQRHKRGEPITAQHIFTTLQEAQAPATEIAEIVRAAVFAAEQLKATGQLPDNNAAFNYAYHHAKKLLPSLEKETLEMWIESMVPLANQAINRDGVPPRVTPKPIARVGLTGLEG